MRIEWQEESMKQNQAQSNEHSPHSLSIEGSLGIFMARPRIQSQFLCAHKNNLKYFKQNSGKMAKRNCLA